MTNLLNDWRIWLFIVSIIKDVLIVSGVLLMKINDLKHIGKDIGEIKKDTKQIFKQLGKIEKDIVRRESVCEERHPR